MLNDVIEWTELHDGGTVVIVVVLTVELTVVGLMQSIAEWQKLKLRKAGRHNNILINTADSTPADTSVNSDRKDVVADTRNFALVVIAIAVSVIVFRLDFTNLSTFQHNTSSFHVQCESLYFYILLFFLKRK